MRPADDLHPAVQLGLGQAVLSRAHDALDAERGSIAAEVAASVAGRPGELTIAASEAAVRDVMLPVELRRAAVAELVARREDRTALERAWAESAAPRAAQRGRAGRAAPGAVAAPHARAASAPDSTVVLARGR